MIVARRAVLCLRSEVLTASSTSSELGSTRFPSTIGVSVCYPSSVSEPLDSSSSMKF